MQQNIASDLRNFATKGQERCVLLLCFLQYKNHIRLGKSWGVDLVLVFNTASIQLASKSMDELTKEYIEKLTAV